MVLQTFFWDKLPQGRVAGTFWAAHRPDYGLLSSSIPEAEELFQVLSASQHKPMLPSWFVTTIHLHVHTAKGHTAPRLTLLQAADGRFDTSLRQGA